MEPIVKVQLVKSASVPEKRIAIAKDVRTPNRHNDGDEFKFLSVFSAQTVGLPWTSKRFLWSL